MADTKNRGGEKVGQGENLPRKEHQGVKAPADNKVPGHPQDAQERDKYLKETEGRR